MAQHQPGEPIGDANVPPVLVGLPSQGPRIVGLKEVTDEHGHVWRFYEVQRGSITLMREEDLRDDFPNGQAELMLSDWQRSLNRSTRAGLAADLGAAVAAAAPPAPPAGAAAAVGAAAAGTAGGTVGGNGRRSRGRSAARQDSYHISDPAGRAALIGLFRTHHQQQMRQDLQERQRQARRQTENAKVYPLVDAMLAHHATRAAAEAARGRRGAAARADGGAAAAEEPWRGRPAPNLRAGAVPGPGGLAAEQAGPAQGAQQTSGQALAARQARQPAPAVRQPPEPAPARQPPRSAAPVQRPPQPEPPVVPPPQPAAPVVPPPQPGPPVVPPPQPAAPVQQVQEAPTTAASLGNVVRRLVTEFQQVGAQGNTAGPRNQAQPAGATAAAAGAGRGASATPQVQGQAGPAGTTALEQAAHRAVPAQAAKAPIGQTAVAVDGGNHRRAGQAGRGAASPEQEQPRKRRRMDAPASGKRRPRPDTESEEDDDTDHSGGDSDVQLVEARPAQQHNRQGVPSPKPPPPQEQQVQQQQQQQRHAPQQQQQAQLELAPRAPQQRHMQQELAERQTRQPGHPAGLPRLGAAAAGSTGWTLRCMPETRAGEVLRWVEAGLTRDLRRLHPPQLPPQQQLQQPGAAPAGSAGPAIPMAPRSQGRMRPASFMFRGLPRPDAAAAAVAPPAPGGAARAGPSVAAAAVAAAPAAHSSPSEEGYVTAESEEDAAPPRAGSAAQGELPAGGADGAAGAGGRGRQAAGTGAGAGAVRMPVAPLEPGQEGLMAVPEGWPVGDGPAAVQPGGPDGSAGVDSASEGRDGTREGYERCSVPLAEILAQGAAMEEQQEPVGEEEGEEEEGEAADTAALVDGGQSLSALEEDEGAQEQAQQPQQQEAEAQPAVVVEAGGSGQGRDAAAAADELRPGDVYAATQVLQPASQVDGLLDGVVMASQGIQTSQQLLMPLLEAALQQQLQLQAQAQAPAVEVATAAVQTSQPQRPPGAPVLPTIAEEPAEDGGAGICAGAGAGHLEAGVSQLHGFVGVEYVPDSLVDEQQHGTGQHGQAQQQGTQLPSGQLLVGAQPPDEPMVDATAPAWEAQRCNGAGAAPTASHAGASGLAAAMPSASQASLGSQHGRRRKSGVAGLAPTSSQGTGRPMTRAAAAAAAAASGTGAGGSMGAGEPAAMEAESQPAEATPHQGRRTRRRTSTVPQSTSNLAATGGDAELGAHLPAPQSHANAPQEPSGQCAQPADVSGAPVAVQGEPSTGARVQREAQGIMAAAHAAPNSSAAAAEQPEAADGAAAPASHSHAPPDADPRRSQQPRPDDGDHHYEEDAESDAQSPTQSQPALQPYGPLVPGGVPLAAFLAWLGPAAAQAAPLVAPPVVPDMMVDPVGFRSRADLASAVLEGVRQPAAAPAWAEEYYLPAQYPTEVEVELLGQLWNDLPTARDVMGPPLMPEEQEAGEGEPGGAAGARLEVAMQRMAEHAAATAAAASLSATEEQVGGDGGSDFEGGDAVGPADEGGLGGRGGADGAAGVHVAGAGGSATAGMGYVGGPADAEAGEAAGGLPVAGAGCQQGDLDLTNTAIRHEHAAPAQDDGGAEAAAAPAAVRTAASGGGAKGSQQPYQSPRPGQGSDGDLANGMQGLGGEAGLGGGAWRGWAVGAAEEQQAEGRGPQLPGVGAMAADHAIRSPGAATQEFAFVMSEMQFFTQAM